MKAKFLFLVTMSFSVLNLLYADTYEDETLYRASCDRLTPILIEACEFQETITVLDNNSIVTAIQENTDIFCQKFEETLTIIAALNAQTTVTIKPDSQFDETFTVLQFILEDVCSNFEQTWTILGCPAPIPLTQGTTIMQPGNYILIDNISGPLTIAADRVTIDLNTKTISGGANNLDINTQSDISIFNGFIENATTNGARIQAGTNVKITDVCFSGNAQGVFVSSSTAIRISECIFKEHSGSPLSLQDSTLILMNNCSFLLNSHIPFFAISNTSCIKSSNITLCHNTITTAGNPHVISGQAVNTVAFDTVTSNNNSFSITNTVVYCNFQNSDNIQLSNFLVSNDTASNSLSFSNFENCCVVCAQNIVVQSNNAGDIFSGLRATNLNSAFFKKMTFLDNQAVTNSTSSFLGISLVNGQNIKALKTIVSQNTASSSATGCSLDGCNTICFKNAQFNGNTCNSAVDCKAVDIVDSQNILLESIQAQDNSTTATIEGFSLDNAEQVILKTCIVSTNSGTTGSVGFFVHDCSDILFDRCISGSNFASPTSTARGFLIEDSTKVSLEKCIAADDNATNFTALEWLNSTTSSMKNTQGLGGNFDLSGYGILLRQCSEIFLNSNYISKFPLDGILLDNSSNIQLCGQLSVENEGDGIALCDSDKNIIKKAVNLSNISNGLSFLNSSTNLIQSSVFQGNLIRGSSIEDATTASLENLFLENIALTNTTTGIFNIAGTAGRNAYFLNKAFDNDGDNFSNVAPVAEYEITSSSFLITVTSPFDNLSTLF